MNNRMVKVAVVKALHLKAELCGLIRCSATQFSLMDSHTVIKTGIRRDKLIPQWHRFFFFFFSNVVFLSPLALAC